MKLRVHPSVVSGTLRASPSKSFTHRALLMAALSGGPCLLRGPLRAEDTEATRAGVEAFGASVRDRGGDLQVSCDGLRVPSEPIDARNSGTTLRLLAGTAALLEGTTRLTGDASLRKRPMGPLLEALNVLGARGRSLGGDGCPPVEIRGLLRGGIASLPGSVSSQFLSSLLIACPLAKGPTEVQVLPPLRSGPYVEMTLHLLGRFGITVEGAGHRFRIPGGQSYRPTDVDVPGDYSSAAFLLAAAVLTQGDVSLRGLDASVPQGDRRILEFLEGFGAEVRVDPDGVRVRGRPLEAHVIDLGDTPDLFPVLAVLATQARGTSRFVNGEHLRLKESDRIATTTAFLRSLGADVAPTADGCIVRGPTPLRAGSVDSHGDHRILMAAAVAGLAADGPVEITEPWCFRVSYPSFLDDLRALGAMVEVVP